MIKQTFIILFYTVWTARAFTIGLGPYRPILQKVGKDLYHDDSMLRSRQRVLPIRANENENTLSMATTSTTSSLETRLQRNEIIKSLLKETQGETDGTKLPDSQREIINSLVKSLEEITSVDTSLDMTSTSLEGEHRLIYIDSERTPQYIGPFKGTTTQYFVNEEEFQNRLTLGPVRIALTALRKRMDEYRMKVKFQSFGVSVFGIDVVNKPLKQQGVWKMVFVGEVDVDLDGDSTQSDKKRTLLRVMRTPSLYILATDLK